MHFLRQAFDQIVEELCIKHNCTEKAIRIAFDAKLPPEDRIDVYLYTKFKKGGYANEDLTAIRGSVLKNQKLNPEIRMGLDSIYWRYGTVVILKGGGKENVREKKGDEAIMQAPWQDEGKFFAIDLKSDPDVIILGPKEILKKFADEYPKKIVYVEDLTDEQRGYLYRT